MEKINPAQQNKTLIDLKKGKISLSAFLVAISLVLAGLTEIIPDSVQAVGIIGATVLMVFTGEIYLLYPIMLFYGSVLDLFLGFSVYRWYTLIFFVFTLLKAGKIQFSIKQLVMLCLFVIYSMAVIAFWNLRRGIFSVLDIVCILLLINGYLKEPDKLRNFFVVYILCAFAAYFTGMQLGSMEYTANIGGTYVDLVRNMATFEDPNYMGCFYTCAIFALIGLKLFSPKVRIVMITLLYAILVTSLSVTAILVNAAMWIAYLFITKSLNTKTMLLILLAVLGVIGLYFYGLDNPDDPTIGTLALRIKEKLEQVQTGNISGATSERSFLTKKHLEYFVSQPFYKILIGMNAASAIHTNLNGMTMAAHNEYVDWLLNVGVIGTLIMLGYLFSTTYQPMKKFWRNKDDRGSLTVTMLKLVFACYALTLTVYGDYRFMLFLLI